VVEAVLTAALVQVILATAAGARNVGPNGAIAVGGMIALSGLWAGALSGASMNPARSIAPDVVRGDLSTTWIYVAGPLAGAALGVAVQRVLRGPPTAEGTRRAQGEPRGGGQPRRG
jgi:aquaporin Z